MKILFVRHAVAEDRDNFFKKNRNDDLRPLTPRGKKDFFKVSKQIKKLFPEIDQIFSSPLVRAVQTAEFLEKQFKKKYKIIKELRPMESPSAFLSLIKKTKMEFVVCVGHEPFLSEAIGYIVTGKSQSIVKMKKGGICLVEVGEGKASEILLLSSPKYLLLKLSKLN